ncbi:extracellular solute-binding protein [Paenibacillus eucommiae]|uniref:Aldouronate transport system substrate-binding protein n=1 Tax=Paenibacillus eucommiae TaxID=1355755 RepID=A0ABS4J321_9BACL|nr:extracellular solute-binding protein [Paenibacillus eucommiae]MBP1994251.1 putative aldouronate transport system substrate-binding protein [Paenibacillus eucommiae]
MRLSFLLLLLILLIFTLPSVKHTSVKDGSLVFERGTTLQGQPLALKAFSPYPPDVSSEWSRLMLWTEYERKSGIHIDWELVPVNNLIDRRDLVLAGEDLPDFFYASQFTILDLMKYGEAGILIPLEDLIAKEAPNFSRLLEQYPEWRKAITMPDGHIFALPQLFDPSFVSLLAAQKLWIKRDWLERLGVSFPQDIEQFRNLLKLIKTTDLNENGVLDETPFLFQEISTLVNYLRGAWGLGNRGSTHLYVDIEPLTNELRFIPADPKYKELLQYIHSLYAEGLIGKEVFSLSNNEFVLKAEQGKLGAFIGVGPTAFNGKGYEGSEVLAGPYGDRLYSLAYPSVVMPGSFAITSHNLHPEETLRWADYFFGDEGNRMFFMGFENITYQTKEDGELAYLDHIVHPSEGMNINQTVGGYLVWPGTAYPGIVRSATFKGAEGTKEAVAAAEKIKPFMPVEIWPQFVYTKDEADQMNALLPNLSSYLYEMQIKFVSGDVPFTEWDEYLRTLDRLGLPHFMELYKRAYERYKHTG